MLKGFISKGKKVEVKEAPPELKEVPTPQEEFLDKNHDWMLREKLLNNNGLTVLAKK